MPHKEDDPPPSFHIDADGNLVYPPTSPADALSSNDMGFQKLQGRATWTSEQMQTGSSSAMKPSPIRLSQRTQVSKKSTFDTSSVDELVDDDQDVDLQLPRSPASLPLAPFGEVENFDKSRPIKTFAREGGNKVAESFPIPPRSGQNAFFSETDENGDQGPMSDDDRSETHKSSGLALSHQRRVYDASDIPVPSQPEGVASSRQRDFSDTPSIEKRPKKKGILEFSSAAPSVTASVDEEPLQEISPNAQGNSDVSSQMEAKKAATRRKPVSKSSSKVKLSALDLQAEEAVDEDSGDPFDQVNIPPSRGVSPRASKRKPKEACKKQSTTKRSKTSPTTKKPSPRHKRAFETSPKLQPKSSRPRQKAKPSAAEVLQNPAGSACVDDNGDGRYFPDEPSRPISDGSQANAASEEVSTETRSTRAAKNSPPAPEKDLVSISSTADSEAFEPCESDGDEYVDKSASKIAQNKQPPRTRNTTTRSKTRGEAGTPSEESCSTVQGSSKVVYEHAENKLATKPLPKKSTKADAVRESLPETELIKSQPTKTSPVSTAPPPPHDKTVASRKLRAAPKSRNSTNDIKERPSASKAATRQVKQAEAAHRSPTLAQDTRNDQTDLVSGAAGPSEKQGPQTRVSRRTRAAKSQDDPNQSMPKAAQDKKPPRPDDNEADHSSKAIQGEIKNRTTEVRDKDRKANILAFGSDGPESNERAKEKSNETDHRPKKRDSGTNTNANTSKISRTEQNPTGSNSRVQKKSPSQVQSAGSSEARSTQRSLKQQPSSQVEKRASVVDSAVDSLTSFEKERAQGSYASENRMTTIVEERECGTNPPPARATNGRISAKVLFHNGGDTSHGDKRAVADEVGDCQFGDDTDNGLDELLIPDSLQQPDDIEYLASTSQVRDAAMISNLLGQDPEDGGSSRKRPLSDQCASRTLLPIKEQFGSVSLAKHQAPVFHQQSRNQIPIDYHPHLTTLNQQAILESESPSGKSSFDGQPVIYRQHNMSQWSSKRQQPIKIKQQQTVDQRHLANQQPTLRHQPRLDQQMVRTMRPAEEHLPRAMNQSTWNQQYSMIQKPMLPKQPFSKERRGITRMSGNLQARPDREAGYHQLPLVKTFSQFRIDKDSAEMYSQDLSTEFQRPCKRAKHDSPGLDVESSLLSNNQFFVTADGLSSDDVFAPKTFDEKLEVDHRVVDQLRGIGSVKHSAAPEPDIQRSRYGHVEKGHELPRQGPNASAPAKASTFQSAPNISQDIHKDENLGGDTRSDLWRRGMIARRAQGAAPGNKYKEQAVVEDPEPYEGVEDVMHRIVEVSTLMAKHPGRYH